MNTWILAATLAIVAAAPAQATAHKSHHARRHHAHAPIAYPDSVTLEGKPYKVCKPGMQDDCVEPRQAGLGLGNRKDKHR